MIRWIARALLGCVVAMPAFAAAEESGETRVIYYLHGKFVEEFGAQGVHPQHGPYLYDDIVQQLAVRGAEVISEVRQRDTDVSDYADRIVAQIRARIGEGTEPGSITVIGASKGAVIGSLVSTRLAERDVRYVLMAACNEWLENTFRPRFTGRLLSIHESTDDLVGSCRDIAARSTELAKFEEITLHTGLGHGFLYRPMPEWMTPALDWSMQPVP
jgi:hypothetical protein